MNFHQASSFGDLLKLFRQRKKLSQQLLANKIEVHRNSISLWERDMERPETFSTLLQLATVLDLDEEEKRTLIEARFGTISFLLSRNIPFDRNPYFTGREQFLQNLHLLLKSHEYMAITQAIVGLGGIGKTQLALEYVYRYQEKYHEIFWINADTPETIISSFIEIAKLLRLPERSENNEQRIVDAVKRWLHSHKGWLLVLDNLEDLHLVKQFVPVNKQGVVLVTTRQQVTEPVAQVIELDVFSDNDGALFLLKRIKRLELSASLGDAPAAEVATARAVAEQLGGLPLALDQAGAYILETGCTLGAYLNLWQQRQSELLARRGGIPTEHPTSVAMTFTLAFEWIQHRNQAAIELLKLCAFLAADAIPEELFVQGADNAESSTPSILADSLAFNDAIAVLRSLSLIRRHSDTHTLSLHRLVQTVLRQALHEPEQLQSQRQVVHLLATIFPEVTYETWALCERLLPHVLTYATNIQNHIENLELADLLLKTAFYLQERAQYERAEPLFKQALHIRERDLGVEHLEVASVLNDLAGLYGIQGKFEQAEFLLKRALHIREQARELEHPDVARMLNKLAAISYEQGKFEQAQPLYERALRIWEQTMGPEHPSAAYMLTNLAMLHRNMGRYEEAQPFYERALRIWEQTLGLDHPKVANPLSGLANLFYDQGKFEQARPLYERALRIREQTLGPDHPEVGETLTNLGLLSYEQGKYEEAQPLYERALHIWEQTLGPDHPEVTEALNCLGLLSYEQGKYEEAQPLYERALHILEQTLGPDHPSVARTLNNLADLYRLQGKFEQAQPLYEHALSIWEQKMGFTHPHLAYPLNGNANLLVAQCKFEEAEQLYKRALSIREQRLGPAHPETAQTLHDQAICFQKQGLQLQAVSLFERALLIRSQSLGDFHPKTVASRTWYVQLVQTIEHPEETHTHTLHPGSN